MESFSYQDLGRIVYAKALDIQTEKFNALLAAKAKGEKGRNEYPAPLRTLFFRDPDN